MELHSGGELFDRIVGRPRFTEDEVRRTSVEVVEPRCERPLVGGAAHVNLHLAFPCCMLLLADGG